MKIKFLLPALLLFTLASCSDSIETVKVDGKYSIDLPSYLSKSDDLNKAASLQYKNAMREFYVLVLDEPKESFNKIVDEGELDYEKNLNGYSEILADDIAKSSGLETTPKMQQTTINNLKARILEFDGTVDNVNIHWKIAYLEGKNRYYQVLTWTIPGKTEDNGEAMMAILKSFKETDKSKRH